MEHAFTSLSVLVLIFAVITSIAVWSRKPTRARTVAVVALLASIPTTAAALAYSLGWPMPLVFKVGDPEDLTILGSKIVVGDGIYVLVDDGSVPRYYKLPWDKQLAEKLQDLQESQREGETGEPRLKLDPFAFSWEKRKPPQVYAPPQPKILPPKDAQPPAPTFDDDSI